MPNTVVFKRSSSHWLLRVVIRTFFIGELRQSDIGTVIFLSRKDDPMQWTLLQVWISETYTPDKITVVVKLFGFQSYRQPVMPIMKEINYRRVLCSKKLMVRPLPAIPIKKAIISTDRHQLKEALPGWFCFRLGMCPFPMVSFGERVFLSRDHSKEVFNLPVG